MTALHLADDTYIDAAPALVAALVADEQRWRAWWPDLAWRTTRDRGEKGRQWAVEGALVGTAEIWLEPWDRGSIVHFFLRVDPADLQPWNRRRTVREWRRRALRWKRTVTAMKDELESSGATTPGAAAGEHAV